MNQITREQAIALAEKHGAELLHGRGFVISPSQSIAMLTDYRQQIDAEHADAIASLQAKLQERAAQYTSLFSQHQEVLEKLEQSEARVRELEREAALGHYAEELTRRVRDLEQLLSDSRDVLETYVLAYNENWVRGMDILEPLGENALENIDAAMKKESGHDQA